MLITVASYHKRCIKISSTILANFTTNFNFGKSHAIDCLFVYAGGFLKYLSFGIEILCMSIHQNHNVMQFLTRSTLLDPRLN